MKCLEFIFPRGRPSLVEVSHRVASVAWKHALVVSLQSSPSEELTLGACHRLMADGIGGKPGNIHGEPGPNVRSGHILRSFSSDESRLRLLPRCCRSMMMNLSCAAPSAVVSRRCLSLASVPQSKPPIPCLFIPGRSITAGGDGQPSWRLDASSSAGSPGMQSSGGDANGGGSRMASGSGPTQWLSTFLRDCITCVPPSSLLLSLFNDCTVTAPRGKSEGRRVMRMKGHDHVTLANTYVN